MSALRDSLLSLAASLPREAVELPGLGTFTVRGLSGTERDAFESSLFVQSANGKRRIFTATNIRAKLVVYSVIDPETGERVFSDSDADQLGKIPAKVIDPLYATAQRLSGLRDDDVEELEKKSQSAAASNDSSGISPAN
jgi:hypothetical protein